MKPISLTARLRYRFDNLMAKGPAALIGALFVVSALLIFVISLIVQVTGLDPEKRGLMDLIWASLMRTLDAGTMGGDTGSWFYLFAMLAVTMGGIFVVSLLIGILSSGIESKLEELRQGRSLVVERNHTVILGWSSQVFSIISELVTANANQASSCIAILAPQDKVEMETEIKDKVGSTGKTRVVCRTGNPIDLTDLEIISPHTARSIIILAPEDNNADTHTIKTILAITNNPNRRSEPYHLVAEIRDPKNMEVARLVGKDEAQVVLVSDLISRITAQTCRQSGLSVVYTELLDFGGDEIYFKAEPALVGKTFQETLFAYEDTAVIGIQAANGAVQLNPPMETTLNAGDKLIVVSEDDDTIKLSGHSDFNINQAAMRSASSEPATPERTLVLGWNHRGPKIATELDNYVAPGSVLTVVAPKPADEMQADCDCGSLANQEVTFMEGDPTDRSTLEQLQVTSYDHIITLGDSDNLDVQEADARTLVTLLHLRDMGDKLNHPFSIVSEMLDIRNRELAEVTRADDFIVSDKLISLMLSQISENKELTAVFQDLFDPDGSELYLKPAHQYIEPGKPVNFYTVLEAARCRGEVAIGYRLKAQGSDPKQSYGVKVNPNKAKMVTFSAEDRIILLADN